MVGNSERKAAFKKHFDFGMERIRFKAEVFMLIGLAVFGILLNLHVDLTLHCSSLGEEWNWVRKSCAVCLKSILSFCHSTQC